MTPPRRISKNRGEGRSGGVGSFLNGGFLFFFDYRPPLADRITAIAKFRAPLTLEAETGKSLESGILAEMREQEHVKETGRK